MSAAYGEEAAAHYREKYSRIDVLRNWCAGFREAWHDTGGDGPAPPAPPPQRRADTGNELAAALAGARLQVAESMSWVIGALVGYVAVDQLQTLWAFPLLLWLTKILVTWPYVMRYKTSLHADRCTVHSVDESGDASSEFNR